MNLYKFVSDEINKKLGATVALEVPKNREFGDFATNAAMVLAKSRGQNPREIAAEILPKIAELPFVADASVAGPGFINIKLKDEFVFVCANNGQMDKWTNGQEPGKMHICPSAHLPITIDLDYGGYNMGKALHIGHFRTTVVGDTYNRVARELGYKTISYNHIGDWGRPMGLIIAWILEYGMPGTAAEINKIYPASTARAKDDENWLERAREITSELQAGNLEYKKIYDEFIRVSLDQMGEVLRRLNVLPFDKNMGERGVAEFVPAVQKILQEKDLLRESDGAQIVDVKTDSDTAPMPPMLFRTSADTQTYAAADLAAIYYRAKTDKPAAIYYFTDSRQNLHFTQVFRATKLADITSADLFHIGYGAITGSDGKPFKTRDGNAAELLDIIEIANEAVRKRIAESGKNLSTDTAEMIALAALKFNDLMHDVKADYVFDPDAITSFEGRTGPYILYTAVRLNSVLKKAEGKGQRAGTDFKLSAEERALLLCVLDFDRTLNAAFEKRATDLLANYAYDLCQAANSFYHNCPILRDDVDDATRAHRLELVRITRYTLARAIDLMGLKIPEEM
jgi:arginyl-tRNA synthetase